MQPTDMPQVESGRVLRVLQLGSPAGMYGAERWIIALVKHLDRRQFESIVAVIQDNPGQNAPLCAEAGRLGFATQIFRAEGRFDLAVIGALRRYIIKNRIDILHTHFYKTDIIGYLATRGTGCKIVSTPHGWSRKMDIKLWCYEMADRMVFPLLDGVAPLSEELYRPLKVVPFLKKKLHLICNGVDLSEIEENGEVDSALMQKKREGKVILGYIGQLIPRKGLDILLDALEHLNPVNWELYLVGDGPEQDRLKGMAVDKGLQESVHFLGFRPDRLKFLRGFDIFVLPSRLEGIPRCLMESMAAGTAVIASDIPGSNSLVEHGRTGLLFASESVEQLCKMIEKMMMSTRMRAELADNAKAFVYAKYSAGRMAKEYERLFMKLTGRN